jgi:alpha-amylase/alpha-mannosidase (GH57 family)
MNAVHHALGLHFHQPPGNLRALGESKDRWEAKEILWCYDRPTRMIEGWEDVARLHLSFSGTLLKQLEDPATRTAFRDVVDVEAFLDRYRRSPIEFLGSGLYHPVYPIVPPEDWDAQTGWWLGLGRHLLGRDRFNGFWPPELGFSMEMIPVLARHGFRYVIVDSDYIRPRRTMRWEEIRYRPHLARRDGAQIVVVPRDRELSNAQLSGTDPAWFAREVRERTKHCDFPALVTTWTDGENGGWFRTTTLGSGFWGWFYQPLLDLCRRGDSGFTPIHIPEFLKRYPPAEEVDIESGAWNTGEHSGSGFTQWTGSLLQKKGLVEIRRASHYYRQVKRTIEERGAAGAGAHQAGELVARAYDHLLTAETSCNFFWGSHWVHRSFDDLERAYALLDQAMSVIGRP